MLGELVIFALVLVSLQMVFGLLIVFVSMKLFMSKKIVKKYVKGYIKLVNEITEEMMEEE